MSSSDSISSGQLTLSPEEELWDAALNDSASTIEKSTADLNCKTPLGNTALHIAASGGCFNAVKALLARGAVIDCQDNDGLTPLFKTVKAANTKIAQHLMNSGADTSVADHDKETIFHWAVKNGMTDLVHQLLKQGRGGPFDEDVSMPIHLACEKGHVEVVKLLLASDGCNVDIANDCEWTPLHEAAFWGQKSVVRLLLDYGASVNALAFGDLTPLWMAKKCGHTYVAELLRSKGGVIK